MGNQIREHFADLIELVRDHYPGVDGEEAVDLIQSAARLLAVDID